MSRSAYLLLLLALLANSSGFAQTGPSAPDSISFQGFATYTDGTPIDGPLDITTKLYSSGSPIYTQVHSGVVLEDGLFNLIIGPVTNVTFNQPLEVGVTLGLGTELSPRTPLLSVPFALGVRGFHALEALNDGYEGVNIIAGASNNAVSTDLVGQTISGGGGVISSVEVPNSVTGYFGTVAGGYSNAAGGTTATVSGGHSNTADGYAATVSGGRSNTASGDSTTVSGGTHNTASGSPFSTIGGGHANTAIGSAATIAGGNSNTAIGSTSTIGGGLLNNAGGSTSTVGGGSFNRASNIAATVPGGTENQASGHSSFAAGYKARAKHNGVFVWNDRSVTSGNDSLVSTAANQFLVRAAGGVGIGTATPKQGLTISRDVEAPAYQLELRNVGDIHGGNFSGIAFTQTASGATESASIKVIYHSNGKPDMSFSVRDAADALFIESVSGDIGIGTTTPATELEVVGTITETSDARFKRDVSPIRHAMSLVEGLRGVTFEWDQEAWPDRGFSSGRQMGLIAQEVQEVVPEVVRQGDDGHYAVAYAKLVPLLIEAIKEQQAVIESQNQRLAAMEARITN